MTLGIEHTEKRVLPGNYGTPECMKMTRGSSSTACWNALMISVVNISRLIVNRFKLVMDQETILAIHLATYAISRFGKFVEV